MRSELVQLTVCLCVVLGGAAVAADAQPISPACQQSCPTCGPGSPPSCVTNQIACNAEIVDCQAKLTAFNGYIGQMRAGVPLHALTPTYREVLQRFYAPNLGQWRFGYSNRQPANNATTPCDQTFFNDSSYVDDLRDGDLTDGWGWLFHEIAHYEQCRQVGGYDEFAKMWWDHLSVAVVETSDLAQLHDQMQLEQQADSKRDQVLSQFRACCQDPSTGELIRPLEVTPMSLSYSPVHTGNPLVLAVDVTGGPSQQTREWRVRPPGQSSFASAASFGTVSSSGESFSWTPTVEGTYTVRFVVDVPSPLVDHREDRQIAVTEPWDGTMGDDHPELGRLLREIERMRVVQSLRPGSPPGGVCLSCPRSFATRPIREALEGARFSSEVELSIMKGTELVADLGRHRPSSGGVYSTIQSATTLRPSGQFRDPASGCGYTIVVKDRRGRTVAQEPTCLDLE